MLSTLRLSAAVLIAGTLSVAAQDLAAPEGPVILTVSGQVSATNAGDMAELDLAMLEEIGRETIETETIWTEGVQTFEGVPLHALVEALGIEGEMLRATAINDYTVEIPLSDAVEGGALVAYSLNGAPMSVRDKGPLWVVYPFDADADFRTEVIYSRSIWQLDRIEAVD
ncbi:molybdopterin-dependent oxidoreductase [Pelagovum pacificum]|uniref:Oxidoreductase n=1 Tax=Pelagovum pacificum TaxID=2588711 RepID=A0A5C5GBQ4_9RHOB|nr:molybdopterin-dependent oxidoreductase [Pelagovum pacificum]QQA44719.1 molybdopterin-dependent oxidoreductase [Pelagovum pacificum]TNY32173.1 oxidoreductase [Pelagovum pacificum]